MPPFSDFNIEFAHTIFSKDFRFDESEVRYSCVIAQHLHNHLTNKGKTCSTSLLIDDDEFESPPRKEYLTPFYALVSKYLKIDYICYESRLHRYENDLINCVTPDKREQVENMIRRYSIKNGNLACSHNVAIWHLLRLGYFVDKIDLDVIAHYEHTAPSNTFFANSVISVLSGFTNYMKNSEDTAQRTIIKYCVDPNTSNRIKRIYYSRQGEATPSLDIFTENLLEQ